jgi:nucleoside-diphosphate-sugar epimerase
MSKNILVTGKRGFIGKQLIIGKAFRGRLGNYKTLLQQTKDSEGIIHLASSSNKRKCEFNPKKCIDSNLLGLCNVLEVALKRNLWVLFISTFQIKEQNLYSLTKLVGEELCRIYQKKGLKVKILRLPIIYGPEDKLDKIVTKFINEIKNGIEPKINNSKKFYFVYVNDIARVIENEVSILKGNFGTKCSLLELKEGIKECLNERKK